MEANSAESFTLISTTSSRSAHDDYAKFTSAKAQDVDIQMTKALREHYPELCVTAVPSSNAPLLEFAAAGFATAELDTETESIFRWRGYVPPSYRGGSGQLGDAVFFAKYKYIWSGIAYIVYLMADGPTTMQYILKEPDASNNEDTLKNCAATDALIKACAEALRGDETDFVYVYDGYWTRSRELWEEVQKASWENVILDPKMKKALANVTSSFFDSKELYKKYGVPWKRGVILFGPPGNGKTVSIKALMKELLNRENGPIPTLYVRDAPYTYDIGQVFNFARSMSPCMLVLEDVETIVTQDTRSYFFNEVDGLGDNDGILMVASTNYLERLDPGLSKRPSRFDRKYNFPLPNHSQREEYSEYWRQKLSKVNPEIEFPKKLCSAIADITKDFSFAYMQEAFIASLLSLAREDEEDEAGETIVDDDSEGKQWHAFTFDNGRHDPLDKYKLWRAMKVNVRMLREDLETGHDDDNGEGDDEDEIIWNGTGVTASISGYAAKVGRNGRADMQPNPHRPNHMPEREPHYSPHYARQARRPSFTSSSTAESSAMAFPRGGKFGNGDRLASSSSGRGPRHRSVHNHPFRHRPLIRKNGYQGTRQNASAEPSAQEVREAGLYKLTRFADTAFEWSPVY